MQRAKYKAESVKWVGVLAFSILHLEEEAGRDMKVILSVASIVEVRTGIYEL